MSNRRKLTSRGSSVTAVRALITEPDDTTAHRVPIEIPAALDAMFPDGWDLGGHLPTLGAHLIVTRDQFRRLDLACNTFAMWLQVVDAGKGDYPGAADFIELMRTEKGAITGWFALPVSGRAVVVGGNGISYADVPDSLVTLITKTGHFRVAEASSLAQLEKSLNGRS